MDSVVLQKEKHPVQAGAAGGGVGAGGAAYEAELVQVPLLVVSPPR